MKRLANAIDLMIEFATLGEFGLETPEAKDLSCNQGRRRAASAPRTAAERHSDRVERRVTASV